MGVANRAPRGVAVEGAPAWCNTRAGFVAGENPMATKDRSTERSIEAMDTVDALLLECVETARRQGFDPSEVADRFDAHTDRLRTDQYTPYTPPVVSYPRAGGHR